jgi:hypothetical protein
MDYFLFRMLDHAVCPYNFEILFLFNDSSGVNLLIENNVMKKSREVAPANSKRRGK